MGIQKNNTAKKCFYSKMIQSSLRSGKWIAVSSSMLLSIALLCTNNLPAVLSYSDGSSSATNTNGTGSPFRTAENNAPQRTDDTGLIEAIVFADTINNVSHASRLWECQGDCDSDSDCSGTLLCMQRDDNEYIPGCYGYEQYSAIDFCYDSLKHYSSPSDSENGGYNKKKTVIYNSTTLHIVTDDDSAWTMMENDIHNNDLDESSESQKIVSLGTCEGHCESDSDCMDNLLCMIRTNTNDPVPGCTGLRIGTQQRNFCYDPATTSVSTPNEKICLYQGTCIISPL